MLRNISFYGESTASDNLENNIIAWLNYNLLETGAFYNIRISTSGSYDGEPCRLRLSNDRNFEDGQCWESFRKQWVWQSGINFSTQPIQISGVFVNNVFRPATGVGPYAFDIDYPNGRIVFTSGISTSSVVKMEYSAQHYHIYNADSPIWLNLQRNSFRIDDTSFLITQSGFWAIPVTKRLQLPAIIVQSVPNMTKTPYQLGNLTHQNAQDFRFYFLTETNADLKWICDLITGQNEQDNRAFDTNVLRASGVYPINMETGSLNPSTMNYPELAQRFSWGRPWGFRKFRGWIPEGIEGQNSKIPVFSAIIQATVETWLN